MGKIAGHKDLDAQSAQMWQLQDRVQHRRKRRERDHQDVQNGSSASGPAECAIPDAVTNTAACTAADMMGLPTMRTKKGTRPTEVFFRSFDPSAALNNLPGARLMFSPRWVRECVCRSGAGVTSAQRSSMSVCVHVGVSMWVGARAHSQQTLQPKLLRRWPAQAESETYQCGCIQLACSRNGDTLHNVP